MRNLLPLVLICGLIYIINLSGFTNPGQMHGSKIFSNTTSSSAAIKIKVLYATGKIPIKKGMPDTLSILLSRTGPSPAPLNTRIRTRIFDSPFDTSVTLFDTSIYLFPSQFIDTTLRLRLPKFFSTGNNRIVVEALPGSALEDDASLIDTVYDSKQYCQDITFDTYNYADPCLPADGGFGFPGRKANFVAGFRNKDSLSFIINSVEQKFFDSLGGGNKPYNIVIYADNSNGPGSLIYKSPNLMTPPGTGFEITLKPYPIDTVLTIQPGKRFYIGYRQTSTASIKAAFQDEIPIRDKTFFFTSTDTGNVWYDFSDSAKNNRIDIAPIVSNSELKINFIMQGFYNITLNMKDTISAFLRNSSSPYAIVDSAKGKIDSVNFSKSLSMNIAPTASYYISIKHRNTIETWSSGPVGFTKGDKTSYNFITAAAQAYGNNMILVNSSPVRYAAYSGDINQDGNVDLSDVITCYNDAQFFLTGYVVSDVNGDSLVDLSDLIICFNNANSFVSKITP